MNRPSPSMAISLIALFVALCGTGYAAASGLGGATPARSAKARHKQKTKPKLVRGPQGSRGPAGPQGPPGQPGNSGQPGPAGTARAYAYVIPHRVHCTGCGEQVGGASAPVLDPTHSSNVALGLPRPNAPVGTWCFTLGAGIDPSSATIVASATTGPFVDVAAIWVPHAGDCTSTDEVEVQTVGYEIQAGALVAIPSDEVAFSFVIP